MVDVVATENAGAVNELNPKHKQQAVELRVAGLVVFPWQLGRAVFRSRGAPGTSTSPREGPPAPLPGLLYCTEYLDSYRCRLFSLCGFSIAPQWPCQKLRIPKILLQPMELLLRPGEVVEVNDDRGNYAAAFPTRETIQSTENLQAEEKDERRRHDVAHPLYEYELPMGTVRYTRREHGRRAWHANALLPGNRHPVNTNHECFSRATTNMKKCFGSTVSGTSYCTYSSYCSYRVLRVTCL